MLFQVMIQPAQKAESPFAIAFLENTRKYMGTPYGTGAGKLNCVHLPEQALIDTVRFFFPSVKRSVVSFPMNGGKLLDFALTSSAHKPVLYAPSSNAPVPSSGDLLLGIRTAKISELDKFYKEGGDWAIKIDNGIVSIIKNSEDAKKAIEAGKDVYFTRHMMVADGKGGAVHASSTGVATASQNSLIKFCPKYFDKYFIVPFAALAEYSVKDKEILEKLLKPK